MPAEAIHLTALDDTLVALPAPLRRQLVRPDTLPALRLGAMFVDLPYFEAITTTLLSHALGLTPRPQPWGDIFHQQAPIALGVHLGEVGARMQRRSELRAAGDFLRALALGYMSHAAVDTALHPLVNRLAAQRADALGDHPLRQHREVEKYQSVLFHEERHGCDYLGRAPLRDFIALESRPLWSAGPVAEAVQMALRDCLGQAPAPALFRQWGRGYERFVTVLGGALGRRAVSAAEKERERPALYRAVDFPGRYSAAVQRSIRWVTLLASYLEHGAGSESARESLRQQIPEQSLDALEDAQPTAPPPKGCDATAAAGSRLSALD